MPQIQKVQVHYDPLQDHIRITRPDRLTVIDEDGNVREMDVIGWILPSDEHLETFYEEVEDAEAH